MRFTRTLISAALVTTGSVAFAQVNINQLSAMAGNVTPGDAPGFPITLSQPGSYKLTTNLFAPAGAAGIEITAPNVTLDMNGFSLISENTCTQNTTTRLVTCTGTNLAKVGIVTGTGSVIRNGNIQGIAGQGVTLAGGRELLERLSVTENVHSGIEGNGDTLVSNSVVQRNYGIGISGVTATTTISTLNQPNRGTGVVGIGAGMNRDGNNIY
jgi:hypothetical protein